MIIKGKKHMGVGNLSIQRSAVKQAGLAENMTAAQLLAEKHSLPFRRNVW